MNVIKLSENIVLHTHFENRFKNTTLSFHYFMPYHPSLTPAITLLAAILKAGCKQYPNIRSIASKLEDLYGADIVHYVRKRGNLLELTFSVDTLEDAFTMQSANVLQEAVQLLYQIVYEPLWENGDFSYNIFEQEKQSLLDSIDATYNRKDTYAVFRASRLLYPDTPFASPVKGTKEEAKEITLSDVKLAYQYFLSSSTVHIYYSGSKSSDAVSTLCLPFLSKHKDKVSLLSAYTPTLPNKVLTLPFSETVVTEQSHVVLSYHMEDPSVSPLGSATYLQSILSTSPSAKLFREVREQNGLCYSCNLFLYSLYGIMMIEAGVAPGREAEAIVRIQEQVSLLQNGILSKGEFRSAYLYLKNAIQGITGSPNSYEQFYFSQMIVNAPTCPEEWGKFLLKITPRDVILLANQLHYDGAFILYGKEGGNYEDT